jgi:hypothetical protein
MFQPTIRPPEPALSLGEIQQTFTFKLRNFKYGDQFTIIEDLPRAKKCRQVVKKAMKTGQPYTVNAIRVSHNSFEADLELFGEELALIAVACPKDTINFKGIALSFDGQKWICVSSNTQDMGFQPNMPLNKPVDQRDAQVNQLVAFIKAQNFVDMPVTYPILQKVADKISPNNAVDLIGYAKTQGAIYEKDGNYKAVE